MEEVTGRQGPDISDSKGDNGHPGKSKEDLGSNRALQTSVEVSRSG